MKLYHLEFEFKNFGSAETVDDWAKDVVINVWQNLEKKTFATPGDFYSWVHKIAFNRSTDAFNDLLEEKSKKVSLFVKTEEGGDDHDGDDESVENPLIHNQDAHNTYVHVDIPDSVQGVDLTICHLLRSGVEEEDKNGEYLRRSRTYAEVANVLGMTEDAVKQRLNRLKKKLMAERGQKTGWATNAVAAD
jgi:DNA-directed RNA polymerase specialized sigma24 family protein